ncbi:unnamed protein product [Euphydryas editha]|uniref:Endonuclease-reverse transcriptase n=1 Tax=Euphydryas editha TaxID=104508 RepID=A0AAU9UXR4_EUPED|nr:unnamed protein product [Euphydryas editha]
MERIDEKLEPVLEENRILKLRIEKLESKIEYLERNKRSNNIIIYGLKEDEKSTTELLKITRQKFYEELGITIEEFEVNQIHRIGNTRNKEKPRPTLLSFINGWKMGEVLKNKKKSKELYITEDYSKETLEKRRALLPQLKEERNKGNIAYLKYDKLLVKEKIDANDKRKREPSASPYANPHPKKHQMAFSSYNNKINAFDLMRTRPNSLTSHSPGKTQQQLTIGERKHEPKRKQKDVTPTI